MASYFFLFLNRADNLNIYMLHLPTEAGGVLCLIIFMYKSITIAAYSTVQPARMVHILQGD